MNRYILILPACHLDDGWRLVLKAKAQVFLKAPDAFNLRGKRSLLASAQIEIGSYKVNIQDANVGLSLDLVLLQFNL